MTDTNTSGASSAPAADTSAPAASAETTAGNFGSTRGSGLARGKRPSGASAPTGTTAKADYKPTALEVIVPVREYKNPFASQEPENAPAAEPAKVEAADQPVALVAEPALQAAPEAIVEAPAPVEAQVYVEPRQSEETQSEKAEINILPPADSVRPAVSWESPSAPHSDEPQSSRDERPTFRPDRREDRPGAPRAEGENRSDGSQRQPRDPRFARQPRDPREARQPRDPRDERQPRDPREARQPRDPRDERQPRDPRDERPRHDNREQNSPASQQAPAPKGFLGWLKGLFGGGAKPAPAAPEAREGGQSGFGDGQRRRRHRGGRGHGQGGGGPQGFRSEGSPQGGDRQHGGGDRQGGSRRRRSRGGSGRDRGGNPRSEGSQGGGAI